MLGKAQTVNLKKEKKNGTLSSNQMKVCKSKDTVKTNVFY
jgi:hypothetical protein